MNPELLARLLLMVSQGMAVMQALQQMSELVKKLQAEDREPTPAEWAELDAAFVASATNVRNAISEVEARLAKNAG